MRIISGIFKNRMIEVPKKAQTRPTSSKMRAQIFNICQHKIEGAYFLDLCAGSGAMGLEALSRNAHSAYFIDHNDDAIDTITSNIHSFQLESKTYCLNMELLDGLDYLLKKREKAVIPPFDIVFIDPPYFQKGRESFTEALLQFFDTRGKDLLEKNGWLFLEESKLAPIEEIPLTHLGLLSKRKSGNSVLFQFSLKE